MRPPVRTGRMFAALFVVGVGVVGTALAQTAPPVQPAVPVASCEKPGDPPRLATTAAGREEAERKRNSWLKSMKGYIDCLKQFIEEEQAAAAAHVKAVNATAEELGKAAKAFNEQAEAARQ